LIVLKTPFLSYQTSVLLRAFAAQGTARTSALDIRWLGFSYIAFRLIHTLRDRQAGRLPEVTLQEYVTYSVFFPALVAGPIDRLERFVKDIRNPAGQISGDWMEGGKRLALGMFKKFVLADGLAIFALNSSNAAQVHGAGWAWWMLYAYSLLIFLDFSGYTDVAIGLARLSGIRLPENFNAPYLASTLTTFWNNWHMTLTQWFRGYVFNPMVRAMRRSKGRLAPSLVLLISQLSLMVLIGLWHGVSLNFVLWGLWHGLGLFFQNRWSDWISPKMAFLDERPGVRNAFALAGGILTFHYVALGWVWFVLPDPDQALRFFRALVGG
jgi:alginate O-acetyltransferase complex protein AlgI